MTLQVSFKVKDRATDLRVSTTQCSFPVWKTRREERSGAAVRMPIELYHIVGSPPCHSVRLLTKTLGVGVNLKSVDLLNEENKSPEFIKVGL